MLTIRTAQAKAFTEASVEHFVEKMVDHHLRCFPEWSETLGAQELTAFVRHGLDRARFYGFETELDVARYLHAMQALGPNFDESFPWAAALLRKKLPARIKMKRLRDAVDFQREARRISDARSGC
jgi:hypothetical protein